MRTGQAQMRSTPLGHHRLDGEPINDVVPFGLHNQHWAVRRFDVESGLRLDQQRPCKIDPTPERKQSLACAKLGQRCLRTRPLDRQRASAPLSTLPI